MSVTVPAPYLPFMDGPDPATAEFRWRLGARPLDLADWIEWGLDADAVLREKQHVMAVNGATAFAVLDGIEAEALEVTAALIEHLGPGRAASYDSSLHPLDAVARLVPDDLVLMVERDGELIFGGGSVCFPNRWDLRSKLGKTMAEVHAPVERLNEQLEAPIDDFFARLRPGRSFWRLGWGILDTADRYTPLDGTAAPRRVDPAPDEMFLRVERETLRRFPQTNCVLFTIRTHLTPLPDAVVDPDVARRLADALDALPDDVARYKDLVSHLSAIVQACRSGRW